MGINKYKQTTNSKSSQPQLMFRNRPTVPEQLSERSREMKLDEHSRSMFYSQNHANKPISIQDDHKPVQKQLHSSLNLGESRSNWKRAEAMKPNSENPVCKIPIDRVWEYPDKSEWGTANNLTITNYHLEVTGSKNIKFNPDDIKRITYHSGEYTLLKIDGRNDKVILSTKENIVKHLARMQNFGTVMAMSDPEIAEAMTLAVNEKRRTSKRFSKDSDDDYVDEYISYEPMGQAKETPKKRNKIELAQEDRFYKKEEAPVRKSSRLSGVGAMQTNEIIFNYPHKGRYCISVREQDVARLNEGEFLNDTVIEFYIRYLCEINADNPTYQKTHFFNSFFFEQLMSSKDERKFEFAYERIRKWTNRVDIFEKDYLIIPVNENLHWYLAIVYNPGACLLELKETDMDLVEEVVAESKVISDETLEYSQQLVQELSSNLVPDNSTIETLSETNGSTLNHIENSDQSMEIDDDVQPNEDGQDDDQSPEITEIPPNLVNSTGEATEVGGFKTVKPKSYETPKIGISKIFKATSEVHQIADPNQGTAEAQSTGINLRSKSVPKRKTAKLKAVDSFSDPAKC
ncbi:hypothetical protein HK103_005604 [Boothiomyces macroporosus]|uniref:Ubiquitin-like protease family profile domain-containing protein n=1 Tax=Boothiomyces macroporosus TaxID=261099 RepID=A0AAD5UEZ8_9FUNG|nr:hypothetical protein HK103_005604 [Boothiomyces macroporosus]